MDSQTINFITWNVNGLKQKREQKFQKLQNADVVFLQETHIGVGDELIIEHLKNEWHVYYTMFTCQKGSAILVKKKIDFEIISNEIDNCGTYVVLKCKLAGQLYTLASVYNHEKDTKTLENLSRYLQYATTGLLVIGGDFNMVLNPFIDKDNKIISKKVIDSTTHRKLRCCVERFMKSLQLVDVWRRMNPINQDYTFQSQVASRLDYFFVPEECMWRVRSCEIRTTERRDHKPLYLEINSTPNFFQKDPNVQSVPQWLNLKKHLLMDETGLLQDAENSNAVSEVDIISAVQSLQVSDTPRPDGIPVSFYKNNIQDLFPYIKTLYNRIHRGAFNCSENHFNETVKSPHDNSQHFFNVDYLIIATILAKHLDDFLETHLKGRVLKNAATVMITPKTFSAEMRLSCITDQIEKQKGSNPALYQVFLIVKNLLRDAPQVATDSVDVPTERDKLLDQGCPLTPVLITLALKCFATALVGHLKHDILVFKESVILCIQPEDLEEIIAVGKNRANEVYDITGLSRANVNDEELNFWGHKSIDEDWDKRQTETPLNNIGERTETNWSQIYEGETENSGYFISMINEEEDLIMEGDDRLTMYAVVTLQDSDEVTVAASNWLTSDKKQCHWPPFRSAEKCMEAVQSRIKPETGGRPWEKLNITFHEYQNHFDTAKERQKNIREHKERSILLAPGFPAMLRRQSAQETAKNQLPPATSSTSRMTAGDQDELLQMMRDIKSTVEKNSTMLQKLLKDNTVSEAPSSTSTSRDGSIKLPLRTFDDVAKAEWELNNATTRQTYVNYLSRLGGFGAKDVIKNIMQNVLTDELAKEFNWQGRGEKKAFSQLNLTDVIRDAASKQCIMRADCEGEIKRYLWGTTDRICQKRPRVCMAPDVTPPVQPDSAFRSFIDN